MIKPHSPSLQPRDEWPFCEAHQQRDFEEQSLDRDLGSTASADRTVNWLDRVLCVCVCVIIGNPNSYYQWEREEGRSLKPHVSFVTMTRKVSSPAAHVCWGTGMEPRATHILNKLSTSELHPWLFEQSHFIAQAGLEIHSAAQAGLLVTTLLPQPPKSLGLSSLE